MSSLNAVPGEVDSGATALRDILGIVRDKWWIVLIVSLVCGVLGMAFSWIQQPVYKSTSTLYVSSAPSNDPASAYQGGLASQQRVASYVSLTTSDEVISNALEVSGVSLSQSEAMSAVSASAAPDTVLLSVSAVSGDPREASVLVNAVAAELVRYVAELESPNSGGPALAKLTVVSPGQVEDAPVSPQIVRNTFVSVMVGLILGLVLCLVLSRLDSSVRSEEAVRRITERPVLSSVPSYPGTSSGNVVDFSSGSTPVAESYRKLRANLSFIDIDNPPRLVLVTSAGASEGKTSTALNLAASIAESGKKVLLVDADLRRPTASRSSGVDIAVGLSNYLHGDGDILDFVQSSRTVGLSVLAAGSLPPNPSELLGSNRSGAGFQVLRDSFDMVVVDSPPVLPVADALVVGQWLDGVVFVVRSGSTGVTDAAAAIRQLDIASVDVLGVVINDVPASGTGGEYGYLADAGDREHS
ncbi:polysaccharide biosynthesis tyrosine autokinase [Gordonia tangerina]|uniref:Polysaccharide biosynthesis tyrosine autokinase n=1 Tax=Gordonia tangerina TaxID=2911060 RepID=A0ABS9DLS4_9ACTN|nr:polysaccharide biosynthesis tyrosine autokinase [Gordonia tangerina]MCF3940189.1 polysaccharide biosynthesis tyrosine autokinase [Gordonia tangerina]